jgi:hypothetical protein
MVSIFTIVTRNHIHRARVLMDGVARFLPDARRIVVLADWPEAFVNPRHENFSIITPDELEIPRYRALAFALNPASLCYAIKAAAALAIRARAPGEAVVYFDSDTKLFAPPTELIAAAIRYGIVLTPHLLDPVRNFSTDRETMRSGAFNGGVFAIGPQATGEQFLTWWNAQLQRPNNIDAAWNHDQGWLNLVPGFFPTTCILRNAGYNVAFWNLHERPVSMTADGELVAGDTPLVLFHFSYFDSRRSDLLAGSVSKYFKPANEVVIDILATYARELAARGEAECTRWGSKLNVFSDGRSITPRHRQYFRERLWDVVPADADPFDAKLRVPGMGGLKSLYRANHWLAVLLRRLRAKSASWPAVSRLP